MNFSKNMYDQQLKYQQVQPLDVDHFYLDQFNINKLLMLCT